MLILFIIFLYLYASNILMLIGKLPDNHVNVIIENFLIINNHLYDDC